jgi:pimeloyl-[acyl-carrier protein] methyl ester esterase
VTAPGVIAITGWAQGAGSLEPLTAALGLRRTAVHLTPADLLAGGGAAGPGGSGQPAAALAHRIADAAHPVVLLGWSLGALVALETALLAPRHVAGVVLLGATARFCRAPGYPCGMPARLVEAMIDRLAREPEPVVKDFCARVFVPEAVGERELRDLAETALRTGPAALAAGLRHLVAADCRERLPGLSAPALIVHGAEDRIIPPAAAAYLGERIPHGRLAVIDGAGHALPFRRLEEVVGLARPFLRELGACA